VKRFRTVVHGLCLLGGRHPEGSPLARECPVQNAGRRAEGRRYPLGQGRIGPRAGPKHETDPEPGLMLRGAP
jgi:hypothetical protein